MPAGCGHRAFAAAAAFCGGRGGLRHDAEAAVNYAFHREAGFRVVREGPVVHGLAHLEAPHGVSGLLGDGFIYVGGHLL